MESFITDAMMAEREAALASPEHLHRRGWFAIRRVETLERQLAEARRAVVAPLSD